MGRRRDKVRELHFEASGGGKVKCKHCREEFAATTSATRLRAHIQKEEGRGIKVCTHFPQPENSHKPNCDNGLEHNLLHSQGSSSVSNMKNEDLQMMKRYVFECLGPEDRIFISPLSYLIQQYFITLKPETPLDSFVIDVFVEILTVIERKKKNVPLNWYLPVTFSDKALEGDIGRLLHFVHCQKMKENYMSDLESCEKIFIPVHVGARPNGHFHLYIIHLKNKEIEIWDSLRNTSVAEIGHEETTKKLLLAMEKLFEEAVLFAKFHLKMADDILLQPHVFDSGIFVINYMQQSYNYVKRDPSFQFDSQTEREDLALKLLNNDLNQEKQNIYDKATRHYAQLGMQHVPSTSKEDSEEADVAAEPDQMNDQLHFSIPGRSIASNPSQDSITGHLRETSHQDLLLQVVAVLSALLMSMPHRPRISSTQIHSPIPVRTITSNPSQDATAGHLREPSLSGSFASGGGSPNVQQAQAFVYPGFGSANPDYPPHMNSGGLEIGSPGLYNDNSSLLFHSGDGFNPQIPYGPYSPVTTPLPSVGGDPQLYSPQQFPYSGTPYYHQLVSPSLPYIFSPTPASQPELTNMVGVDRPGDPSMGSSNDGASDAHLGSLPSQAVSRQPIALSGQSVGRGSHQQPSLYGFRSGPVLKSYDRGCSKSCASTTKFHGESRSAGNGIWSDSSKPSDRQMSMMPLSPAVSPQPFGSFGQSVGMASHQPPLYRIQSASGLISEGGDYVPHQGSSFGASLGDRKFLSLENSRQRERRRTSSNGCDDTYFDVLLNEQNRSPRASKHKNNLLAENVSVYNSKKSASTTKFHNESINRPEFITDYEDAKFFVITSYSEDNVRKSIKYGVWASAPNENRKLDAAYRQAKDKQDSCPVFLLFSVNASAQFCGVAEMVGPVDFDKSVDYWQQDKWSGQFPVKWHIIKDVPNSQFRHIVLENNDNKPVTNSRDTQEVKLQQGIEMLTIFKNYESQMSILDDFDYYVRQKTLQERKARQQASLMPMPVGEGERKTSAPANINGDFVKQMLRRFAQVVCLKDNSTEATAPDRGSLVTDGSNGRRYSCDKLFTINQLGRWIPCRAGKSEAL